MTFRATHTDYKTTMALNIFNSTIFKNVVLLPKIFVTLLISAEI